MAEKSQAVLYNRHPADFHQRVKAINSNSSIKPAERVKPADKDVYFALTLYLEHGDDDNWWTQPVSIQELQTETGHQRTTISRSINKLARHSFIYFKDHELRAKRVYFMYAWLGGYQ